MKKKIIIFVIIFVCLFIPIRSVYFDGGTVEYKAIVYKYIKWHRVIDPGLYYEENELILFPKNFRSLSYYAPIYSPSIMIISDKNKIFARRNGYSWSKEFEGEVLHTTTDGSDPLLYEHDEAINIRVNDELLFYTTYKINEIEYIDKENNKNILDVKDNKIKFENTGEYIVTFRITDEGNNYADYSFKVIVG